MRLFEDAPFKARYKARFLSLLDSTLSPEELADLVDELASQVGAAAQRDYDRWGLPPESGTHEAEIAILRNFLVERAAWIQDELQTWSESGQRRRLPAVAHPNPSPHSQRLELKASVTHLSTSVGRHDASASVNDLDLDLIVENGYFAFVDRCSYERGKRLTFAGHGRARVTVVRQFDGVGSSRRAVVAARLRPGDPDLIFHSTSPFGDS